MRWGMNWAFKEGDPVDRGGLRILGGMFVPGFGFKFSVAFEAMLYMVLVTMLLKRGFDFLREVREYIGSSIGF